MRILIRRGNKVNLPTLNVGEFGLAEDTQEVFIGTSGGNIEITTTAASGIGEHGSLVGLNDDDHTQYHNDTRGDTRYLYKENVGAFTPDGDYEPSTKKYVDDGIATLSGSMVLDHGGLTGLGDDDHTQYILVNGTKAFSSTISGISPTKDAHLTTKEYVDDAITTATGSLTTDHGALTGLGDDDHTQYILANGVRSFSSTISGTTPTEDAHLATKEYVDDAVTTATGSLTKEWIETDSNYSITRGENIFVNSISGSYTLTMYSNPAKGDNVTFVDNGGYCETNNVTISGGQEKLQGQNQYLYLDEDYDAFSLIYGGVIKGWITLPTLPDFVFTVDQA